jgi:hypothetical protein
MTQGITYRTPSFGTSSAALRPVSTRTGDRVRAALRVVHEWLRALPELPDNLVEDAAPHAYSATRELRNDITRLDAALRVRFY